MPQAPVFPEKDRAYRPGDCETALEFSARSLSYHLAAAETVYLPKDVKGSHKRHCSRLIQAAQTIRENQPENHRQDPQNPPPEST